MQTVAGNIDLVAVAKACGYNNAISVSDFDALDKALDDAKNKNELSMIEVKCAMGARQNLGRPTTTALQNKRDFMEYMRKL